MRECVHILLLSASHNLSDTPRILLPYTLQYLSGNILHCSIVKCNTPRCNISKPVAPRPYTFGNILRILGLGSEAFRARNSYCSKRDDTRFYSLAAFSPQQILEMLARLKALTFGECSGSMAYRQPQLSLAIRQATSEDHANRDFSTFIIITDDFNRICLEIHPIAV